MQRFSDPDHGIRFLVFYLTDTEHGMGHVPCGRHNRLGFVYPVAFVRVLGRWKNVILDREIKIDPAPLKMRDPYSVFLHESGQYPSRSRSRKWGALFSRYVQGQRRSATRRVVPVAPTRFSICTSRSFNSISTSRPPFTPIVARANIFEIIFSRSFPWRYCRTSW